MYKVSDKFRERVYSGGALYNCKLKIDNQDVPISQIAKITISNPIIDTSSETFYVGSFISQKITIKFKNLDNLTIYSGEEVSLTIGLLVDDDYEYVPIGKFIIDDLGENYQETCEISCLDYAVKMKPNIDYSPCFVQGKATIDTILEYICNQFGVELDSNYPKTNGNIEIGTYDSTISGKRWVSYIAEIKGCNAKIGRDGVLYLIPLKNSVQTRINALKSKSWELGTQYQISKVTFDDGARPYSAGDDTKNTLYIRNYNPFIKDQTTIDNIYNVVKDTVIWNLTTENYGDISLDPWDNIAYDLGDNSYNTLMNVDITYEMNIMSKNEVKIPTKQQEVTTNVVGGDDNSRYLRIGREIDLINGTIRDIVEKTIDISKTLIGIKKIDVTSSYGGDLHRLNIFGNFTLPIIGGQSGSIATLTGTVKTGVAKAKTYKQYLPPLIIGEFKVASYPILTIKQNNEVVSTYTLPIPYLNSLGTIHDDFEYLEGKCTITRRVVVAPNGMKYPLDKPYKVDLPDMKIEIPEGDFEISINIDDLTLEIEYLTQNEYTDIFATKVDVTNEITTSADGVLIKSTTYTDKTVDDNINDGNKLIASINTKSSGDVLIDASKLAEINANKINFNSYDFNVTTQNMKISIGSGDNVKDIINANGVLTNLIYTGFVDGNMFVGSGDYIPLGRVGGGDTADTQRNKLTFAFKLPSNYVVQSAKIFLSHAPAIFTLGEQTISGYSRNLKLYKGNVTNLKMHFNLENSMIYTEGTNYSEIPGAFFSNDGFTGSASNTTNIQSIDIKNYIDTDKENFLSIYDGNYTTYTSNEDIFSHTGSVFAYLEIIGYSRI